MQFLILESIMNPYLLFHKKSHVIKHVMELLHVLNYMCEWLSVIKLCSVVCECECECVCVCVCVCVCDYVYIYKFL